MEIMKQNDLLYRIRILVVIAVILALSACNKKIKEVKIIAFDLIEAKGIPEVTLYLESGETLVTDQNGEAVLTSRRDLTDNLIGIPSFLDEYGDAGLKDNCEPTTSYKIESSVLLIPFRKKTVYQVNVFRKDKSSSASGCVYFHGIECLVGVASSIEVDGEGNLDLPRFSEGNIFYYPVYPLNENQEIKIFYEEKCGTGFNSPDSSYVLPVVFGDTNVFEVYI